jgi:ABC-type sugar transport system permease subunit
VRVATVADKKRQDTITGLAFIAPALLILLVFLIVPMFAALYFSTTNWDGITPSIVVSSLRIMRMVLTNLPGWVITNVSCSEKV